MNRASRRPESPGPEAPDDGTASVSVEGPQDAHTVQPVIAAGTNDLPVDATLLLEAGPVGRDARDETRRVREFEARALSRTAARARRSAEERERDLLALDDGAREALRALLLEEQEYWATVLAARPAEGPRLRAQLELVALDEDLAELDRTSAAAQAARAAAVLAEQEAARTRGEQRALSLYGERRNRRAPQSFRQALEVSLSELTRRRSQVLRQADIDTKALDAAVVEWAFEDYVGICRAAQTREQKLQERIEVILAAPAMRRAEISGLRRQQRMSAERASLWRRLAGVLERLQEARMEGWVGEERSMLGRYKSLRLTLDELLT